MNFARNWFVAITLTILASNTVLAQEQAEQPEIDPSANQPQQTQPTPAPYPADDGAPVQQTFTPPQYQQSDSAPPYQQFNSAPQQPAFTNNYSNYAYAPPAYGAYQPPQYSGYTGYAGYAQPPQYPPYQQQFGPPGAMLHPRVATAPAGLTIPVTLQTAISTQVAKQGDFVQASINQNVPLSGLSYIPSGSVITGQITEAQAGRMMDRSGSLGVEFDKLQLPDGESVSIQAHVLGDIGKYEDKNGEYHGEGWGTKLGNFALRSAVGAGSGAALGSALGAICGRVGTGAWAGTAIGGGIGALDSVFLRRGRNVLIQSGTPMQIQLDSPVQIPVNIPPSNQYGAS